MADTVTETLATAEALVDAGDVRAAIDMVRSVDRVDHDTRLATESVRLRHEGFHSMEFETPVPVPQPFDSQAAGLFELTELTPDELTVANVREAMAETGCVLVRGLIDEEQAARLRAGIDRSLDAFDARAEDPEIGPDPYFVPFRARSEYGGLGVRRRFMRDAGSMWAVDSPRMFAEMVDLIDDTGFLDLVEGILEERPALSANKFNIRRVPIDTDTNWHQDGAFLGPASRTVNLWLSLSSCGVDAPGLDLVPRRLDEIVATGTEGAAFEWSVAQSVVDAETGDLDILHPTFGPGDALIFDHFNLHRTAVSDGMVNDRYAIESWFFAPSEFPEGQIPILL